MVSQPQKVQVNKAALDAFTTAYYRIRTRAAGQRLWSRLMPAQRQKVLDDKRLASNPKVVSIWQKLYEVGEDRAVIESAKFLNFLDQGTYEWLLREIGEFSDDPDDLEHVFAFADLVMIENQRKVYWLGQEITVDWGKYHRPWEYLLILATRARKGMPVDRFDFGDSVAPDYHVKMKSYLGKIDGFPMDLAVKIENAGVGTQTLAIARERIRIFRVESREVFISKP